MPRRLTLVAALAIGLAATAAVAPARADTQTIYTAGVWTLYSGTSNSGRPLCGMKVSDTQGVRTIHIKYFGNDDHLTVQMFKTTWQVPNGTRLPIVMRMDGNSPWRARAFGEADHIEFTIPYSSLDVFAREFRFSGQMIVSFPEGSEGAWNASLTGTNIMLDRFVECMHTLHGGGAAPSQPYSGGSTTPSQPFSSTPTPTQPTQPGSGGGAGGGGGGGFTKNFGGGGGSGDGGSGGSGGGTPSFGGAPSQRQPYRGDNGGQGQGQTPAPSAPVSPPSQPGNRI